MWRLLDNTGFTPEAVTGSWYKRVITPTRSLFRALLTWVGVLDAEHETHAYKIMFNQGHHFRFDYQARSLERQIQYWQIRRILLSARVGVFIPVGGGAVSTLQFNTFFAIWQSTLDFFLRQYSHVYGAVFPCSDELRLLYYPYSLWYRFTRVRIRKMSKARRRTHLRQRRWLRLFYRRLIMGRRQCRPYGGLVISWLPQVIQHGLGSLSVGSAYLGYPGFSGMQYSAQGRVSADAGHRSQSRLVSFHRFFWFNAVS
jgi:hypothetical protein